MNIFFRSVLWRGRSALAGSAAVAGWSCADFSSSSVEESHHNNGIRCNCEAAVTSFPSAALQTRSELISKEQNQLSSTGNKQLPAFDLNKSYKLLSLLGKGAYGEVFHAKRKSDGKSVALKAMPRVYTGQTDFEREVAALQLLSKRQLANNNNQNGKPQTGQDRIVQLVDLHRDSDNYYLVMEYVEGGELFDHLIAGGPFSEGLAASFLRQFAEGLDYTHSAGLVHADLKPENLLLTMKKTKNGREETSLKLIDFGCACTHDSNSKKDMQQLPLQEFAAGCSFLHLVALGNQFELEQLLMEKPSLINFKDYDFRTPLHLAASEGHLDICRFLVAKGARINRTDRWGGSPLDDAHREQHKDVVEYLRQQGARFGNSATAITKFIEAASSGDVDEVRALLDYGTIDINQGDYDKRTALHLACSEGWLDVVELLIKEGADVSVSDRWGNKPLDDARCATKNSKEIMKLLKINGAVSPSLFLPFASRAKKKGPGKTIPTMSSIGTIVYWPPEMFVEATTPKPSMDMWSAGVIMYIVLTGSHPFDKEADKTDEEVQELLMKVGSAYKDGGNLELLNDVVFDERVSDLSPSSIDLMKKLMHPDPKKRLTSEQFLRHPWIQGITAKKLQMKDAHQKLLKRYTLV